MVATVESPFTFFQEPVEMFWLDAVKAAQMPFCLVPKILYPIDMITSFGKQPVMIDSVMMKTAYVQRIIRLESVCVDDAVRLNLLLNDRHQRFLCGRQGLWPCKPCHCVLTSQKTLFFPLPRARVFLS